MLAVSEADERVIRLLHDARLALEEERRRRSEPIAIVGMGCRLPGAPSPARFWQLLEGGVDATGDVPRDRWDAAALYDEDADVPGKAYVGRGAFLPDIAGFEPEFFGISPREAVGLDPQQRLLLEVSWEALEDAGINPQGLSGSATGVWIGQSLDDYAQRATASGNLERIDPYNALGSARSVAAGRIAYVLGLHGPVMQVDTSCSSSLVAVHLACQSLRARECDVAIVGGVNLIASPETTIALCKLRALARDGRCKTFDAAADGYGRGEGCGVVVLRRASDAQAACDRIYAEIRGSALNHDGRSNGLTAPNGTAQEAVLRQALANAGLEPNQVQYVEAHGTGTLLGDPIEMLALNRVYGSGHSSQQPLYVGSAKTNIGHLEAAAGIAALIKAALSIGHGIIPPHLHLREPNPKIPWRELPVRIPTQATSWPSGAARVVGVSSFGMSGTNAHVLLGEAPAAAPEGAGVAASRAARLVLLSARTDEALRESAARLRAHLASEPELGLDEVAATLALGRSPLKRRAASVLSSREELDAALATLATGERELAGERDTRQFDAVAWLFPGQGAQLPGMGRALAQALVPFRRGLEQAMAVIDPHLKRPLASVLWAEPGTPEAALLTQTAYTQPALFAFGWALAELWRSLGIVPRWVAGHSLGELTAAAVAGVFSLSDAARLVCARGRLMQALPEDGAMLSVEIDADDAAQVIEAHADRVAIAAINAPGSVVLSGDRGVLQQIAQMLSRVGVAHKPLPVSHAFHSPLVEPMLEEFSREASSIDYRPPRLPIVSNLSGALAGPEIASPEYWVRHVREPVRFARGVQALHAAGARAFFELGARAVLLPLVEQTLASSDVLLVPSGRGGKPEIATLLEAVGACWERGASISWRELFPSPARRCRLPAYPWQRQRYWQEVASARGASATSWLGDKVVSAGGDVLFESSWSLDRPTWVADHRVGDEVIVPAAAIAELARAAAESLHGAAGQVRSLLLEKAIVLARDEPRRVQVLAPRGALRLGIYSRPAGDADASWTLHATAELAVQEPPPAIAGVPDPAHLEPRDVSDFYAALASVGLNYGASFRAIERLWSGADEAIAQLRLAPGLDGRAHGLHPALLDAAFQLAAAIGDEPLTATFIPVELHGLTLWRRGSATPKVRVRLAAPRTPDTLSISVAIADAGGLVAGIDRVVFRRVTTRALAVGADLYELIWRRVSATPFTPPRASWSLLETPCGASLESLARALRERGALCDVGRASSLQVGFSAANVVCFWDRDGSVDTALAVAIEALEIAQLILASGARPRLWWVTRGAISVLAHEVSQPGLAAIWGLGRTLMQEHPELGCTLVDVDDAAHLSDVLASESTASDRESQVAWRAAERHVLRLKPALRAPLQPPLPLRTDGTVLITGGLGALGLEAAHSLAELGVRRLILASRRRLESPALEARLEALERLGAQVSVVQLDVRELEALRAVIDAIPSDAPLRGVIHAAGLQDDALWLQQTPARLENVMAPKVVGAWNLHRLTRDADLDFFVLFSSIAGAMGSAGQAGYAAANACLDALADHRRALGLPAQSLAFGPWQVGLAGGLSGSQRDRLTRQGVGFLSPERGRAAFEHAIARREAALVVAELRPHVAARALEGALPALWRELVPERSTDAEPAQPSSWRATLGALATDAERLERSARLVAEEVCRILSVTNVASVPHQQPLGDLGLDSLMALELRRELSRRSGLAGAGVPVTSRSSVASLAASLLEAMLGGHTRARSGPQPVAEGGCVSALSRPDARLFCFHYAGGSAQMFEPFEELARMGIEVHTISHTRAKPASAEAAREYLAQASAYIAERSDVPYAIFGHSLGGLFAWRVLEQLLDQRAPAPQLFVPSAAAFPEGLAGDFSDEALAQAFRRIAGDRTEASGSLLGDFIADSRLWRELPRRTPWQLPVRIAAFVGRDDHIASEAAMRAWAARTSSGFSFMMVAGDHFYLSDASARRAVLAEIARLLAGVTAETSATV